MSQEDKTMGFSEIAPSDVDYSGDEIEEVKQPKKLSFLREYKTVPKRENIPSYKAEQEKFRIIKDLSKDRKRKNIKQIKPETDIRSFKSVGFKEDLYESLVNLVLNHRSELKKMPSLMTEKGAQEFADKSNGQYRYKKVDLNNDNDPDLVLYNKAGQPVIINGYKIKSSDFGYINKFRSDNPTAKERAIAGGYNGWFDTQFGFEKADKPWKPNTVKNPKPADFEAIVNKGYKRVAKPKTKVNLYTLFTKLIAPIVKEYWDAVIGDPNNPSINPEIPKVIRPLNLYRILYILMVEQNIFQHYGPEKGWKNYAAMKKEISGNKVAQEQLLEDFIATFITNDKFNVDVKIIDYYLSEFKDDDGNSVSDYIIGADLFEKINKTFPKINWRKRASEFSEGQIRAFKADNEDFKTIVDRQVTALADTLKASQMFGGEVDAFSQNFDHKNISFDKNASSFLGTEN